MVAGLTLACSIVLLAGVWGFRLGWGHRPPPSHDSPVTLLLGLALGGAGSLAAAGVVAAVLAACWLLILPPARRSRPSARG